MYKIAAPKNLSLLNLPATALKALNDEILAPVDDIALFTTFWTETGTILWHLNHNDSLPEDGGIFAEYDKEGELFPVDDEAED